MQNNTQPHGVMKPEILIVETEKSLRLNLIQHVRQEGFEAVTADQMDEVRKLLAGTTVKLVLLGLGGPRRDGISILGMIRRHYPHIRVITINSSQQFELSLKGMRLGAFDDFLIPFDLEALMSCVRRALNLSDGRSLPSAQENEPGMDLPGGGTNEAT